MDEQTLFETESTHSPAEIASLFHHLGDSLRDESQLAFHHDNQTTTLQVPSEVTVSVEVEAEGDDTDNGETEVEIKLEWDADKGDVERQQTAALEEVEGFEEQPTEGEDRQQPRDQARDVVPVGDSLTPTEEVRASLGRFEVYRDRADEWRWRLVHRNGNIIATSGEGYTSRQNAEKGLRSVMTNAPGAAVTTSDET